MDKILVNRNIAKSLVGKWRRQHKEDIQANDFKEILDQININPEDLDEYNAIRVHCGLNPATPEEFEAFQKLSVQVTETKSEINHDNKEASMVSRYSLLSLFVLAISICIGIFIYAFKRSDGLTVESCFEDFYQCWTTVSNTIQEALSKTKKIDLM